ncbi:MAG: polysaccharide biosynthesis/export family protein [Longimicrobiales bacterium]
MPADPAIQPGDRIALWVWEEPEMAREYAVDENGMAVLPKLGPVRVAGLSPDAVRDSIRVWYATNLTTEAIDVRVLRRIGVRGEVRAPSLYWVDPTLTAQDVITLAGGLTPDADEDEVELLRDAQRYTLGRGLDRAVALESGDQLLVGRRSWFSLNAPFVVSTSIGVVITAISIYLAETP